MPRRTALIRLAGATAALVGIGYALYWRSDARRTGNRLFYRDGRPNGFGRAVGRLWSVIGGMGIGPSFFVSLETTGLRTGVRHAIPMVVADYGGERYLVSMLGERSPWVRNVRAAGGRAAIRHGQRHEVHLVELAPDERAPVIKAYLARAMGGRPHIPVDPAAPLEAFERIAASYPVFRIEPAEDPLS